MDATHAGVCGLRISLHPTWPRFARAQVESLVSRTSVVDVALGDHHSVFLDHDGGIWTCGENKEVGSAPLSRRLCCHACAAACV